MDIFEKWDKGVKDAKKLDATMTREAMGVYIGLTDAENPLLADDKHEEYATKVEAATKGAFMDAYGVDLGTTSDWMRESMLESIGLRGAEALRPIVDQLKESPGQLVGSSSAAKNAADERYQLKVVNEARYGDAAAVRAKIEEIVNGNRNLALEPNALENMPGQTLGGLAATLHGTPASPDTSRQIANSREFSGWLKYVN